MKGKPYVNKQTDRFFIIYGIALLYLIGIVLYEAHDKGQKIHTKEQLKELK
jgi:hypothetical protein